MSGHCRDPCILRYGILRMLQYYGFLLSDLGPTYKTKTRDAVYVLVGFHFELIENIWSVDSFLFYDSDLKLCIILILIIFVLLLASFIPVRSRPTVTELD